MRSEETKKSLNPEGEEKTERSVEALPPGEFGYLGVLADRGAGVEVLDVYGRTPQSGTYLALNEGGVTEATSLAEENGGRQVAPLAPHRIKPNEIIAYRPMDEAGNVH